MAADVAEACFLEITEKGGDWFDQMFDGRLPMPGEVCDLVCVSIEPHKLRFKLRVRDESKSKCGATHSVGDS